MAKKRRPAQVKNMREALRALVDAVKLEVVPGDYGEQANYPLTLAAIEEAQRHIENKRYVIKVKGGYVKTEGGGWACGVDRRHATTYTEQVAYAYAHELGGKVEPAFLSEE